MWPIGFSMFSIKSIGALNKEKKKEKEKKKGIQT